MARPVHCCLFICPSLLQLCVLFDKRWLKSLQPPEKLQIINYQQSSVRNFSIYFCYIIAVMHEKPLPIRAMHCHAYKGLGV